MQATPLLHMKRQEGEARLRALSGEQEISVADARDLIDHAVDATRLLRYTWEYPRRALGEAGLDPAAFREVCREVLSILDTHLTLLGLIRQTAILAADRERVVAPRLGDLEQADAQVREHRRGVEDLMALASRSRGAGIDWTKVREAEKAFARGEFVRLNADEQVGKVDAK